MKVCLHKSKRVMESWPEPYCDELFAKLIDRGDRAFVVTDDLDDAKAEGTIAACDYFVGTPGKYLDMAKAHGVKTVALLGPTLKGEGVRSPIICAGCKDKLDNPVDCYFGDEVCMWEIPPNDVLEAICSKS